MLNSNLGNENSVMGHIKCSCRLQVSHPWLMVTGVIQANKQNGHLDLKIYKHIKIIAILNDIMGGSGHDSILCNELLAPNCNHDENQQL